MLESSTIVTPVAVTDLERAAEFYIDVLGLSRSEMPMEEGEVEVEADDGTTISLHREATAGSEHTVVAFLVDDLDVAMQGLLARGVVFIDYNEPEFTTEDGVFTSPVGRSAWFRDPDGNVLSVYERNLGVVE